MRIEIVSVSFKKSNKQFKMADHRSKSHRAPDRTGLTWVTWAEKYAPQTTSSKYDCPLANIAIWSALKVILERVGQLDIVRPRVTLTLLWT